LDDYDTDFILDRRLPRVSVLGQKRTT